MNEYIKLLLEQIRCKKAHPMIEAEIRSHIEDQIAANIADGMTAANAEKAAVVDMGSPVESGISLDMIHKPAMAWDIVILVGIISTIAILFHRNLDFTIFTAIGFLLMLLIYRIDYSFMAKYAKWMGAGIFFLILFTGSAWVTVGDGSSHTSSLAWIYAPWTHALLLLYVPIYCALLYQYYGTGKLGVFKSLLWMIIPTFLVLRLPALSIGLVMFFSMAVIFSLAVLKGWFHVSKKITLFLFWSVTCLLPVMLVMLAIGFHWLKTYQIARIKSFFTGESTYTSILLKDFISNSLLIGGNATEAAPTLQGFDCNYVFTYFISSYGILAGVLVGSILLMLLIRLVSVSLKQKNQLGMIMGCGCGMILFTTTLLNMLENFDVLPIGQTFLPFVSNRGSFIVVSYLLLGIVMSVYRHKNILPVHVPRTRKDKTLSA